MAILGVNPPFPDPNDGVGPILDEPPGDIVFGSHFRIKLIAFYNTKKYFEMAILGVNASVSVPQQ